MTWGPEAIGHRWHFHGACSGRAAFFVVPAGEVGVITTLGKVSDAPRLPGLNIKTPFVQSVHYFNVRTQVRPEEFSSLTKDLQVIEATATVKYAEAPASTRSTARFPRATKASMPASFSHRY